MLVPLNWLFPVPHLSRSEPFSGSGTPADPRPLGHDGTPLLNAGVNGRTELDKARWEDFKAREAREAAQAAQAQEPLRRTAPAVAQCVPFRAEERSNRETPTRDDGRTAARPKLVRFEVDESSRREEPCSKILITSLSP